jgi:hypothetical protein
LGWWLQDCRVGWWLEGIGGWRVLVDVIGSCPAETEESQVKKTWPEQTIQKVFWIPKVGPFFKNDHCNPPPGKANCPNLAYFA